MVFLPFTVHRTPSFGGYWPGTACPVFFLAVTFQYSPVLKGMVQADLHFGNLPGSD
jgi:hypothetical protein